MYVVELLFFNYIQFRIFFCKVCLSVYLCINNKKCDLGKSSTHAIIWAKLIMSNGDDHGLHAFVVKIRDKETMLPYPGVIVGDLGEKASLNGVDNG